MLPPIFPGELIAGYDFRTDTLPDCDSRDATWSDSRGCSGAAEGIVLRLGDDMVWSRERDLRIRDVCVRACIDALDPGVRVRVVARKQEVGKATLWYELGVTPEDRSVRLARLVSAPGRSDATALLGPYPHQAVAPLGASNIVELRVRGPTLEGWVNGVRIGAVHDATLGIGSVALAAGSMDGTPRQKRALVRWFEIREVAT